MHLLALSSVQSNTALKIFSLSNHKFSGLHCLVECTVASKRKYAWRYYKRKSSVLHFKVPTPREMVIAMWIMYRYAFLLSLSF